MIFQQNSFQKPVFFDNDGGIDDLITLLVLLTLDQYRLTGVALTNGVSPIGKSTEAISKLFSLFCRYDLQVAQSTVTPVHQFPEKWRSSVDLFLNNEVIQQQKVEDGQLSKLNASDFMAEKILNEPQKTIIVATGPASNLQQFISKYPEAVSKIEHIIWMGGTIDNTGNVLENGVLQRKEWNIYWDAQAANQLINSGVPIELIPIDTVQQAPVTAELLNALNKLETNLVKVISPILHTMAQWHDQYYFWDVLTTSALLDENIILEQKEVSLAIQHEGSAYAEFHRVTNGASITYPSLLNAELFSKKFLSSLKQF